LIKIPNLRGDDPNSQDEAQSPAGLPLRGVFHHGCDYASGATHVLGAFKTPQQGGIIDGEMSHERRVAEMGKAKLG
jgi:hypothetical protein